MVQGQHLREVRATLTGLTGQLQQRSLTIEHPIDDLELCLYSDTVCYLTPAEVDVGRQQQQYIEAFVCMAFFFPNRICLDISRRQSCRKYVAQGELF